MKAIHIELKWKNILYDLEANTWKSGFLQAREDGRQGETQVSEDETIDLSIAKRNAVEAVSMLAEVLNRWTPTIAQTNNSTTATFGYAGITTTGNGTVWNITVSVTDRSDATDAQASLLAHSYVVSQLVAEWYKLTNPSATQLWEERKHNAEIQLTSALYWKVAPTEPS